MSLNEQKSLTVVGSINADLIVRVDRHPQPGETLMGSGGEILAGGKGANQAVAAAQLGAQVRFVGAVGDDAYAEPALHYLHQSGVDMSAIEYGGTTGLAIITVDEAGENTIVLSSGANADVDGDYVAAHAESVRAADVVLLQGEIPASGFAAAVNAATSRVVINLAPVVPVDRQCLLKADPLLANEHEAGLILDQLGAPITSSDPADLAQALLEAGFKSVVLTLGAAGALVATSAGLEPVATPHVQAVDTTGAGDGFAGSLCARLVAGDSLVDAARFAARVGAFAATGHGAQPSYPTAEDQLPAV